MIPLLSNMMYYTGLQTFNPFLPQLPIISCNHPLPQAVHCLQNEQGSHEVQCHWPPALPPLPLSQITLFSSLTHNDPSQVWAFPTHKGLTLPIFWKSTWSSTYSSGIFSLAVACTLLLLWTILVLTANNATFKKLFKVSKAGNPGQTLSLQRAETELNTSSLHFYNIHHGAHWPKTTKNTAAVDKASFLQREALKRKPKEAHYRIWVCSGWFHWDLRKVEVAKSGSEAARKQGKFTEWISWQM